MHAGCQLKNADTASGGGGRIYQPRRMAGSPHMGMSLAWADWKQIKAPLTVRLESLYLPSLSGTVNHCWGECRI